MEKQFDTSQAIRRIAPKHAATAMVFRDSHQPVYGVVSNLSLTGACIVSDSRLTPGRYVGLKLSFYRHSDLFESRARVVWNRRGEAREKGFEGLQLSGVQFTLSSTLQKSLLSTILGGEDFVDVFRLSATEFDALQKALSVELDELGRQDVQDRGENRN